MQASKPIRSALLLLILIITAISYHPTLQAEFTNWDDNTHITENPSVRSLSVDNLGRIFSERISGVYIPLTTLSYALEFRFFGLDSFIFHLDNLLLHLGVVILVLIFLIKIGLRLPAAMAATLIFAVHPIHVESVAWVTERKDVLYAFFYLMALCTHIHFVKTRKKLFYVMTIILGILSMLAKSMAVSLPLLLLLVDWFLDRQDYRKALLEKIPLLVLLIPIAGYTFIAKPELMAVSTDVTELFLIPIWIIGFYVKNFFFPVEFVPYYQLPTPVSFANPVYLWAIGKLVFILACLWHFRRHKWIIFSAAYFFLSIFFLIKFDDVHPVGIATDRWMYLPCLGFCIALGYLFEKSLAHIGPRLLPRAAFGFILTLGLMALSFKTFQQTKVWENSFSLWSYVIEKNQNIPVAYNNRGLAYSNRGQLELAMADYNKALSLDPMHVGAYVNRGAMHVEKNEFNEAVSDYETSLKLNANFQAFYNLGNIYRKLKKYDLALDHYTKAIEVQPRREEVYNNRGVVFLNLGEYEKAYNDFSKGMSLNPLHHESYNNRGFALSLMGKYDMAIRDFEMALKLKPDYMLVYYNRGKVYRLKGNFPQAIADLSRAIELKGNTGQIYLNRSMALAEVRQYELALKDALMARSLGSSVEDGFIQSMRRRIEDRQ